MKYLLIIGDGMADNPVPQLGGKTPLQAAHIPTIDYLAAHGTVGSVVNCPEPLPPGSETAILSIFGCDPRRYFTGRSPMEAAASGIAMRPGDAAFRCNLVTLEDGDLPLEERKILSHSAGSIDGPSALETVDALLSDPEFSRALAEARITIHPFPAFRQLAVQHESDISGIAFYPPHDHLGEKAGAKGPLFVGGGVDLGQRAVDLGFTGGVALDRAGHAGADRAHIVGRQRDLHGQAVGVLDGGHRLAADRADRGVERRDGAAHGGGQRAVFQRVAQCGQRVRRALRLFQADFGVLDLLVEAGQRGGVCGRVARQEQPEQLRSLCAVHAEVH